MRRVAFALLAFSLCGCSHIESAMPALAPPAGETLASYMDRLHAMNEQALAAEAARQRRIAAANADDLARVRAALALSLAPHGDENEILALVDPVVARRRAAADVRGMASFLQAMAADRRRLRESAAAAGQKLREEHHAREQEKQRADALQERAADLQQKLDAFSELEKSLSKRPPTSP
ncbi:MAG TPA: hypothetical protein VN782_04280 [Usitatibacter sp.]|nr:hypothetical protein [Usitatibacter sp.]